jgi:replicative DNA helicase
MNAPIQQTQFDPLSLHSIELEQALLGAILNANSVFDLIEPLVSVEDFFEPLHHHIFRTIAQQRASGGVITLPLVRAALGSDSSVTIGVSSMTVGQYVARLASEAITVREAPSYARQIREFANKRRVLETFDAVTAGINGNLPSADIASAAIAELDAIAAVNSASAKDMHVSEAVDAALARMQFGILNPGKLHGITWGLRDLDERTGGLRPSQLVIAAGRPGMGKSALATTVARLMAEAGHPVLFITLEMGAGEIASRAIADACFSARDRNPMAYTDFETGKISSYQGERAIEAGRLLKTLPIKFVQQGGLSMGQIAAKARKHKVELERKGQKLDAVIIDHIGLVKASNRYAGNRVHEITEISGALKVLAKDLDVAVIALAQLNRAVENRDDKRPHLSDLRDSGSIEQDADTVVFVYREAYYLDRANAKPQEDAGHLDHRIDVENRLEVIIAKQRNGPTGTVNLFCNIACNAVRNAVGTA